MDVENFDATKFRGRKLKEVHKAGLCEPKYIPTEREIELACLQIQVRWSEDEAFKRAAGPVDCEPYGLEAWMICPECQRYSDRCVEGEWIQEVCSNCLNHQEAVRAGRYDDGSNHMYHRSDWQDVQWHDIQYHGGGTNRSDCPPWWEGLA